MELGILEIELFPTTQGVLLRYKDSSGLVHQGRATLTLPDVEVAFREEKREKEISRLKEGSGHRTVEFKMNISEQMRESFGFNEVGAI